MSSRGRIDDPQWSLLCATLYTKPLKLIFLGVVLPFLLALVFLPVSPCLIAFLQRFIAELGTFAVSRAQCHHIKPLRIFILCFLLLNNTI